MIRPGDRVDVMVTYKLRRPGAPETPKSKTILKFIEVFALDRMREGEGTESSKGTKIENLSLLVTPEQAHVLALAKDLGKLQLALRSPQDKLSENEMSAGLDENMFDELVATAGLERPAEPAAPKAFHPAPAPAAVPSLQHLLKSLVGKDKQAEREAEPPKSEGWVIRIWENDKVSEEVVGQYGKRTNADDHEPPLSVAPAPVGEEGAGADRAESRGAGL
jgi:Flp pilus assembly protein CpaB